MFLFLIGCCPHFNFEISIAMSVSFCFFSIVLLNFIELSLCNEILTNIDGDTLVFAHTLCRHGERNPYQSYPNDPWKSEKFWPGGFAALTNVGRQEHYTLGQYLRQRYTKLLERGGFLSNAIFVQSTDTERTLSSVEANLAGFLSFPNYRELRGFLNWQPISVQVFPNLEDYLLASMKPCDRFDYVTVEYLNEDDNYEKFFKYFRPLIDYIEKNSGINATSMSDLLILYDTLRVEKSRFKRYVQEIVGYTLKQVTYILQFIDSEYKNELNDRLPDWAENVMQPGGDYELIALFKYQLPTITKEMKKLKAGFLLKEIFDRFLDKTQSKLYHNLSLWMYFAHDVTMVNVLNSLGLYEMHFLSYASCIFFELYESGEDFYVQVAYRNTSDSYVPPLKIPNCGTQCPLFRIYELYKDILPTKCFDEECELHDGEVLPPGGNPESFAV